MDWIKEGLPHYLARILCEKCKIPYSESRHQQFFPIWKIIHEKYNLSVLTTIIYAKNIRITKNMLKNILNYEKDDILEISYQKAKELIET